LTSKSRNHTLFVLKLKEGLHFYETNSLNNSDILNLNSINKKTSNVYENIKLISLSDNFLILPSEINKSLSIESIGKTLSKTNINNFKKNQVNNIEIYFKENYKNKYISSYHHISEILISKKNINSKTLLLILFLDDKIIIVLFNKDKLLFYNQFKYVKNSFIKYIFLVFEEYGLKKETIEINIIDSFSFNSKIKNEFLKYFDKIVMYKKSLNEIITSNV
tara:strand:+ start:1637 stop:2296 length:660 start_codon:yes stop_codon:yes gene_type:complete